MRTILLSILLLILVSACTLRQTVKPTAKYAIEVDDTNSLFHRGVYSLTATDKEPSQRLWNNNYITGVVLRVRWSFIETAEGQYDWGYLDAQIRAAKASGKKLSIYIKAGKVEDLPEWLLKKYALQLFSYDDANPYHECSDENPCKVTFAASWDPIYLEKWTNFIKVFGSRYQNESTIAYVRGASQSVLSGWEGSKLLYDETGNKQLSWSEAGFTAENIINAAKKIIDVYVGSFPNAVLWDEPVVIKPWNEISGATSALYVSEKIVEYGFGHYPDRYGVWREDLHGCIDAPPIDNSNFKKLFKILWEHQGKNGAQMLWNVQDGTDGNLFTFRMNPKNCAGDEDKDGDLDRADVLKKAVDAALAYQMPYIEIYQADILDPELQDTIAYAHTHLYKENFK